MHLHTFCADDFVGSLLLGEKDEKYGFVGDITNLNLWSQALASEDLDRLTNCGEAGLDGLAGIPAPDLIAWQVKSASLWGDILAPTALLMFPYSLVWQDAVLMVSGNITTRSLSSLPCTDPNTAVNLVLMPYAAESQADAVDTCKSLGGRIHFPARWRTVANSLF